MSTMTYLELPKRKHLYRALIAAVDESGGTRQKIESDPALHNACKTAAKHERRRHGGG